MNQKMETFPDITLVIPVYNEGESIRHTVSALKAQMTASNIRGEIVVVDDGSTDNTTQFIDQSESVRLVRHPRNLGYGASLKSGIKAARNEWIVITDADLTYPAEQLPDLLAKVPAFDMVVGARQGSFYFGTPLKRVLRLIFKLLVEFATGYEIPDINSGFRVFRKSIVEEFITLLTPGFSFTTTMTLIFFLSGRRVEYVPVSYSKRAGKSHVKLLRDSLRSLQFVFEAMLAYNPIKAFMLLTIIYMAGGMLLFVPAILLGMQLTIALLLGWSTVCVLMGFGFLGTAIQLGRRVHVSR